MSKNENIDLPYAKSYATGQIVLSLIDINENLDGGAFGQTIETAERIENDRLRAYALWSIARAQSRKGFEADARDTQALARRATDAIGSSLSRVWMLSDIAAETMRGAPSIMRSPSPKPSTTVGAAPGRWRVWRRRCTKSNNSVFLAGRHLHPIAIGDRPGAALPPATA